MPAKKAAAKKTAAPKAATPRRRSETVPATQVRVGDRIDGREVTQVTPYGGNVVIFTFGEDDEPSQHNVGEEITVSRKPE